MTDANLATDPVASLAMLAEEADKKEAKVDGRDERKVAHSEEKTNVEDEKSSVVELTEKSSPIGNAKVESGPSHPASIVQSAVLQFFKSPSQQVKIEYGKAEETIDRTAHAPEDYRQARRGVPGGDSQISIQSHAPQLSFASQLNPTVTAFQPQVPLMMQHQLNMKQDEQQPSHVVQQLDHLSQCRVNLQMQQNIEVLNLTRRIEHLQKGDILRGRVLMREAAMTIQQLIDYVVSIETNTKPIGKTFERLECLEKVKAEMDIHEAEKLFIVEVCQGRYRDAAIPIPWTEMKYDLLQYYIDNEKRLYPSKYIPDLCKILKCLFTEAKKSYTQRQQQVKAGK